jgi:hypothetical protein
MFAVSLLKMRVSPVFFSSAIKDLARMGNGEGDRGKGDFEHEDLRKSKVRAWPYWGVRRNRE